MPLTEAQLAALRALVNRIIPPDDFPGGWEAGAGDYLLRQLAGDLAPLRAAYAAGLSALDAEAQAAGAASFAAMPAEAQDALLVRVEAGRVAAEWPIDPAEFFRNAVTHTAEGYYSDPGNGGNRGGVAWQMLGYLVKE